MQADVTGNSCNFSAKTLFPDYATLSSISWYNIIRGELLLNIFFEGWVKILGQNLKGPRLDLRGLIEGTLSISFFRRGGGIPYQSLPSLTYEYYVIIMPWWYRSAQFLSLKYTKSVTIILQLKISFIFRNSCTENFPNKSM